MTKAQIERYFRLKLESGGQWAEYARLEIEWNAFDPEPTVTPTSQEAPMPPYLVLRFAQDQMRAAGVLTPPLSQWVMALLEQWAGEREMPT